MSLATVLVGGAGSRLRAELGERPKCLAEINGVPFIVYLLYQLRHFGFTRIVLLSGHGHDDLNAYVGDGSAFGVTVEFARESAPAGTAGALRHAQSLLTEPFLLLNGDTIADCELRTLCNAHTVGPDRVATIAVAPVHAPGDFGRVRIGADQRVEAFDEKAASSDASYVSAGVYCVSPQIYDYIPAKGVSSLEFEVFPDLVARNAPVFAFPCAGFFDIGTPERLAAAQRHPYFQNAEWLSTAAKPPFE